MCQPSTARDDVVKLSSKEDEDYEDILPSNPIAKIWVSLYRLVPRINFPGTNVSISFTVCSATLLYCMRLTIEHVLVSMLNWPPDEKGTMESVGSLAAICHSIHLIPGLFVALTSQPYVPTGHLSTAPKWWRDLVDALLQFCTGYMIYDSLTSFILPKGFANLQGTDYLFLGHHIATAIYMTQCRFLQAGHTSAMICMFLGEFSNPFQNGSYALANAILLPCCNGPMVQQLYHVTEFLFAVVYFGIRAIIAPLFFVHVTYCLLLASTRKNIPLWMRIFWIVMIWGVELGSYAWIVECWRLIQQYLGITNKDEL